MEENKQLYDKLFLLYNLTMQREKKELKSSQFNDISVNDLHIVHIVALNKNITISQISQKIMLTKATLTRSIDKLERLGYVERVYSKSDRRVTNIKLARRGKLLYRLHNLEHKKYVDTLLSNLSKDEKTRFSEDLDKLIEYIK